MRLGLVSVARSDRDRLRTLASQLARDSEIHLEIIAFYSDSDADVGLDRSLYFSEQLGVSQFSYGQSCLRVIRLVEKATARYERVFSECSVWIEEHRFDAVIVFGDRYEMLAAASASTIKAVQLIHIGGGYVTEGAIDDQIRRALTALSSLHLVANSMCADNVISLGASPSSVRTIGSPDVEQIHEANILTHEELEKILGITLEQEFILATFHPETKSSIAENKRMADEAAHALSDVEYQVILTAPCSDPGSEFFREALLALSSSCKHVHFFENLGASVYFSLMRLCGLVLGNSSSGMIEAGYIGAKVVNVGDRQKGREITSNIYCCKFNSAEIRRSVSEQYASIDDMLNPTSIYGGNGFSSAATAEIKTFLECEIEYILPKRRAPL